MEAAGVGRMPTLSDHMSDGRRRGKDLAGIGMLVLFAAGMAGVVLTWLLSRYASLVPDPAIGDGESLLFVPRRLARRRKRACCSDRVRRGHRFTSWSCFRAGMVVA